MLWRHVTIGTHNSWLPGEPRGFRAKNHSVHSSGDYRNPPPVGEHAGLFVYSKKISAEPIIIPSDLRAAVGKAMIRKLSKLGYQVLAVSVAGMHSHMLVELPADVKTTKRIVGHCKSASSLAIRDRLPGRVWGRLGSFKPVKDPAYQKKVYRYILDQEDAWHWSYRDGIPED